MDDESKRMHVDSLNAQVSNHQPLKDCLSVIKHAGSSGKGFPYAPEDFPSPGDVWTWHVGKRRTHAGFWQDRSVHPPDRLQSSTGSNMSFRGRASLEQYIRKTFPDADVDAFFASFVWKIPCTNVAKDAFLKAIKSMGCSKSAAIIQPRNCKASNEMCRIKAKTGPALTPATCNVCCSEPDFCRYCCCILCSKTIDWIYDGYNFIKCEALVDENFICGHVAHIECALRAYLAGKVGGNIDLDAQYYCRYCDNKTDLLLHVEKIIKVSESIDNRDDLGKVLNLGFCMLHGSEKEGAEELRNHIATSFEKLKHGVPSEGIRKKRSEISELERGSQMGRSYLSEFGKSSSYNRKAYYPSLSESYEERKARKERERKERERHEHRHEQSKKDGSSSKRLFTDDRPKSHDVEDSSKRQKIQKPSSSEQPISSAQIDIHSDSPALPAVDIQQIINRPKYILGEGPAKLQSTFPNWFLKGVRFDLDMTPIDKDSIYQNLDAAKDSVLQNFNSVKEMVDKMHNWQKLVDELQRVNRYNCQAMLTAENDKSEWDKVLKDHQAEMNRIAESYKEIEAENEKLKGEATAASYKEELLKTQVKTAHDSQTDAEKKLLAEQEKTASQATEIANLRAKLKELEQEKDLAVAQKISAEQERDLAEQSLDNFKTEVDSKLLDLYALSVMGRGSLSFLGDEYEITLAEVWERILAELIPQGFTEEQCMDHYLDDEARAALARGKEQLASERVMVEVEIEPSKAPIIPDPTFIASSSGMGDVTSILPPPQTAATEGTLAEDITHAITEHASQEDKDESNDDQEFEVQLNKTLMSGNFFDLAQEESFFDFEEYLYDDLSPFFVNDTNATFSSLLAATPDTQQTSPPPVNIISAAEATPNLSTQPGPGSQSELIGAMRDLDASLTPQEFGGSSDTGGGDKSLKKTLEKTPEVSISPGGTESSTKKPKSRKKLVVPKGKVRASCEEEKEEESTEGKKSRSGKLPARPGDSSKGGKKKLL